MRLLRRNRFWIASQDSDADWNCGGASSLVMATMKAVTTTTTLGAAATVRSPLGSSSSASSCAFSCPSLFHRGEAWSLSCCGSSRSKSLVGGRIFTGDDYVQSVALMSRRESRRKARTSGRGRRLQQMCAGASEPGDSSSEPGSNEPGASGASSSGGKEEDMDFEASFRLQTTDWRAFRARLVKGATAADPKRVSPDEDQQHWAHSLVEPEKGCLLIAHPTAFGSRQPYFNQAVIFLFEHDEDGSAGFILNRPTSYALGQVPGFEEFKPEFTQAPLYMGGDVGTNLIQVIHGVPGLRESKEVISGVYLGGPNAVKNSVKDGETAPNDFRWFLGYCGWRPGQLEREVAHGVWYLASSSKDIVTNQCIRLKRPLWRQVLELMGGEYSAISRRAYGEI